jgi:hypothetical protein
MIYPFIENDQYNFIIKQAANISRAAHSVNDKDVKHTFVYSALDKVLALFTDLNSEQEALLTEIVKLDSEIALEQYKEKLLVYCIPFTDLTDSKIKKLFRKVKKLHYPDLTEDVLKNLTYFSWHDAGANQKFIIKEVDGKLVGVHGRFIPSSKKGICHFCNHHAEVGLLTVDIKLKGDALNYKALGNYFCVDSTKCNQQITDTEKLDTFLRETIGK